MILEGIVTTISDDGAPNISPMGPVVDTSMTRLVLRPYRTSTTYQNLRRRPEGVFHVTDDVELLARAATGGLVDRPAMFAAHTVCGQVLTEACRWYEFRVSAREDQHPRTNLSCEIVHRGRIRDFFGFNRAKHAVVEAAILATRTEFLPAEEILTQYDRLSVLVEKTAGPQERRAFDYLHRYVRSALGEPKASHG